MPDVYASIETADEAVQERLAEVLELRAADAAQQAMLEDYLRDLPLPDGARVLEVGCGTGAVARTLAARPGVGEVVGLDPSPVFVQRAREIAVGVGKLSYLVGGGTHPGSGLPVIFESARISSRLLREDLSRR